MSLHVFTDDEEYAVAESEEDARRVFEETWGFKPDWEKDYIGGLSQCPDDKPFTIREAGPAGENVTKTFGEWAAEKGRGYLCASAS